jgi:hypothetical protein
MLACTPGVCCAGDEAIKGGGEADDGLNDLLICLGQVRLSLPGSRSPRE